MSDIFINQTLQFEWTVTDQDDVIVDLSTALSYDVTFERPDRTSFVRTPVFITDGVDGQVKYVAPINELDQEGKWKAQGLVVDAGGEEYPWTIEDFSIKPRIV